MIEFPAPVQSPRTRRLLNPDNGLVGKQILKMLMRACDLATKCECKIRTTATKHDHRNTQIGLQTNSVHLMAEGGRI